MGVCHSKLNNISDHKTMNTDGVRDSQEFNQDDLKNSEQVMVGDGTGARKSQEFDPNLLSKINTVNDKNNKNNKSNAKTCNDKKQKQHKDHKHNDCNYNNFGGNTGGVHGGNDGDDEKKRDEDDEEEEEKKERSTSNSISNFNVHAPDFTPSTSITLDRSILNGLESVNQDIDRDNIDNIDNDMNKREKLHSMLLQYQNEQQNKPKRKIERNKGISLAVQYGYDPIFSAKNYIKIPERLTNIGLPKRINKSFSNLYRYIDRTTSLQISNGYYTLCNYDTVTIISYDLYDVETNDNLYCVITKEHHSEQKRWKMKENVYTMKEIVTQYNIDTKQLPDSLRSATEFKAHQKHENIIKNMINNKLDINKIKWHKITIKKRPNHTKRLTLSLNNKAFIKTLTNYINTIQKETKLIDILIFDNESNKNTNNYHIEYVWIVRIAENTDIGISLTYNTEHHDIDINGIHLDKRYLLEQHELINRNHECHCLDSFESQINDLIIGNPDHHENRAKAYKKTIVSLKKEKDDLQKENMRLKKENDELINNKKNSENVMDKLRRKIIVLEQSHSNTSTTLNSPISTNLSLLSNNTGNTYLYQNQQHLMPLQILNINNGYNISCIASPSMISSNSPNSPNRSISPSISTPSTQHTSPTISISS